MISILKDLVIWGIEAIAESTIKDKVVALFKKLKKRK
jgi:hypothetical protein